MNPTPNTSDGWQDCRPGEVSRMVDRLRRRRRQRTFGQAAAVTAGLLVAVFAAFQWFGADPAARVVQPIACKRVHDLAPTFVAGKLDAERSEQVEHHLGRCRTCRHYFARQFPAYVLPPMPEDASNRQAPAVVGATFAAR
jgi:hypothetical protein